MVCVFDIKKTEVLAFHFFPLFTLLTAIYLFNVRGEVRGTRYLSLTIIFFFLFKWRQIPAFIRRESEYRFLAVSFFNEFVLVMII